MLLGKIIAEVGRERREVLANETIIVPKNKKHRITGVHESCILEVAFGKVLEKDIIRYEDDYGRAVLLAQKLETRT